MRGKCEHFLVKSVFNGDFPYCFRRKKLLYNVRSFIFLIRKNLSRRF